MQSKTTLVALLCVALLMTISCSQGTDGEQSSRESSLMKTEIEGGASAQSGSHTSIGSSHTSIGSTAKTLSSAGRLPGSPSLQKEEDTATDAPSDASTFDKLRVTASPQRADAPSVIYAQNKHEQPAKEEHSNQERKDQTKNQQQKEEPKKEELKEEPKKDELKEESKKDEPKDELKEETKAENKDESKEGNKDEPKEGNKDESKEGNKEDHKEELKEDHKEELKEDHKEELKEDHKEELKEDHKEGLKKDTKAKDENKDSQIQSIDARKSQKPAASTVVPSAVNISSVTVPPAEVSSLADRTSGAPGPNAPAQNKISQVGKKSGAEVNEKSHSGEKQTSPTVAQTPVTPAIKEETPVVTQISTPTSPPTSTPTSTEAKSSQDVSSAKDQPLFSATSTLSDSPSVKTSSSSSIRSESAKLTLKTLSPPQLAALSSEQSTPTPSKVGQSTPTPSKVGQSTPTSSKVGQSTPTSSKVGQSTPTQGKLAPTASKPVQSTPTDFPSLTASSQAAFGQSPSEKSNSDVVFAHSSTEPAESDAPVSSNATIVPAAPVEEAAKASATPITTNSTQAPTAASPKDSGKIVPIQSIAAYLSDYKAAENILNISLKVYAEMQLNKKLPLGEDELQNYDILKSSLAVAKSLIRKTANKRAADSTLSQAEIITCKQYETNTSRDIAELTSKINMELLPSAVQPPKASFEPAAAIVETNPLLSAAIPAANSQALSTTPSSTEVSGAIAVPLRIVEKQGDDVLEAPSAKDGAKTLSIKSLRTG